MKIRTTDALQVIQKIAREHLDSGLADHIDDDSWEFILLSLEHVDRMVACLKDGKSLIYCAKQDHDKQEQTKRAAANSHERSLTA